MPNEKLMLSEIITSTDSDGTRCLYVVFKKGEKIIAIFKFFSKNQAKEKLLELKHELDSTAFSKIIARLATLSNNTLPMNSDKSSERFEGVEASKLLEVINKRKEG